MIAENGGCESTCISKTVSYPISLYESLLGRYFTAQTPHLPIGIGTNAWGALYNPRGSGINLHLSVVTLNFIYGEDLTIGFYMNSDLPGSPCEAPTAAANMAICPLPRPETRLLYASDICGFPQGGEFLFSRTAYPGQLTLLEEDGKFIVPPGGNYCAFLRSLMRGQSESMVYLAFGWWEEPVC
jgi:hypothetical protein